MEPDLYQHLPPGVTLHTARMLLQGGVTIEAEERMLDEYLPKSAQEISTMRPDVVVFGCTSAGALRGPAYEQGLAQQLSQTTGAPAITIMGAVVEELNRLDARRVAVLSPYSQEVNETIQRSLEASGFDVVYLAGMDLPSAFGIADVSPEQVVDYARKHLQGVEADCLFVSCANLRSLEAIEGLRAVADMPVITSNQAVLESVKRVLEIQHHDMAIAAAPEG
jgi:maleate isomerase